MNTEDRTSGPASVRLAADHGPVPIYEIRVAGRLASRWSAWFDDLTVTTQNDGTTVLAGPVVDQAALHGLLQKLRDLGIPLVSLTRTSIDPTDPTDEPPARPTTKEH